LALILAAGLCGSTAALAQSSDVYHPASEENPASGKEDFMNHCAPCHGDNGKGNGPELKVLPDIHPTDLTKISLKNGGVFPTQKVMDMVDGRKVIPSHKRFDMPFWGVNFQQEGKEFTPESEAKAKARIEALVDYIKSIQKE
jgi:mono/diheme cytochrome c family protein